MKEKVKNIATKTKTWVKEHKKVIIGALVGTAVTAAGIAVAKKKHDNEYYEDDCDFEPGRDCKMRFIVDDDSNEVLGEVPCTESYAKDMIDIYSNEMLIEDKEA